VLASPGQPLDAASRVTMERRLEHDFSHVRVHADGQAARSAAALGARAWTVGPHVTFAAGAYQPGGAAGDALLAHELVHVMQQDGAAPAATGSLTLGDPDDPAEREAAASASATHATSAGIVRRQPTGHGAAGHGHGAGAAGHGAAGHGAAGHGTSGHGPAAKSPCAIPASCPAEFCSNPFSSRAEAILTRDLLADGLLFGIGEAVDARVVPLWRTHLFGGSALLDLSSTFGADFTASKTTKGTTDRLAAALKASLERDPPTFPQGHRHTTVDLRRRIPRALAEVGDPPSPHRMNFNAIGEIPGNIAGDIGTNQKSCKVGAKPSPIDDSRSATGDATLTRHHDGSVTADLSITFVVEDTVDLCPGNCGADIEQLATVPISWFEAAGISGDVPFRVTFPAPPPTTPIRARPPSAGGTGQHPSGTHPSGH
jgi:Domain of unknown function (DUF4157)